MTEQKPLSIWSHASPCISGKVLLNIYQTTSKLGGQHFISGRKKIPCSVTAGRRIVAVMVICQLYNSLSHSAPSPEKHTPTSCHR